MPSSLLVPDSWWTGVGREGESGTSATGPTSTGAGECTPPGVASGEDEATSGVIGRACVARALRNMIDRNARSAAPAGTESVLLVAGPAGAPGTGWPGAGDCTAWVPRTEATPGA